MPGKKGKKKKKEVADDVQNPATMIGGIAGTQTGSASGSAKGGKKKKKKLTAAEKALAKLEKSADTLRQSGEAYGYFVDRMDKWLLKTSVKAIATFRQMDVDGEEVMTYDEFKSVMYDLEVPCTSVELHLLCQILDTEEADLIEYLQLTDGMKLVRQREALYNMSDIRPPLQETSRQLPHCTCCKMALWDGENYVEKFPRYVEVLFRLVTFEGFKAHPGHFNILVHTHINVYGLMQIIRKHCSLLSTKLAIFIDKSRDVESMLPQDVTLEDCGIKGGTRDEPEEMLLYYDYVVEFTECPLLMCDHYFGQKVKV